jgi:AcrR family transcriptional regulator
VTPQAVAAALRRRRGLDDARTSEIYAAALAELGEVGYDRMTMDAVARRASASKATLYRHWPGKPELVVEAIRHVRGDGTDELPDTGSVRGDLRQLLGRASSNATHDQVCMMRGMVSACGQDAELARVFHERVVEAKRSAALAVLRRAQQRGEVSDRVDIQFLVDVAPAMLVFRHLLTPHQVDDAYLDRLVDDVWLPLLAPVPNPSTDSPAPPPQGDA